MKPFQFPRLFVVEQVVVPRLWRVAISSRHGLDLDEEPWCGSVSRRKKAFLQAAILAVERTF